MREASSDTSLLNPDETMPGNWQIARPADTARAANRPPPTTTTSPPRDSRPTSRPAAELPPLPDEDELDGLFVDLVEEV